MRWQAEQHLQAFVQARLVLFDHYKIVVTRLQDQACSLLEVYSASRVMPWRANHAQPAEVVQRYVHCACPRPALGSDRCAGVLDQADEETGRARTLN